MFTMGLYGLATRLLADYLSKRKETDDRIQTQWALPSNRNWQTHKNMFAKRQASVSRACVCVCVIEREIEIESL